MSTKIASLTAVIEANTSNLEAGMKKTRGELTASQQAFAQFASQQAVYAKNFEAYEAQKAKAIAATERAAAKLAKEEETAAKAAAKAAEAQRKADLSLAPGLESKLKGVQEFTQANAGLISVAGAAVGAVVAIGAALNKTIDQVVEYGDQVQKLKTITGQSAEATSNTIQLADDARISYDQLTVSLTKASKQGIDTSINGLAKLSEQYKALAPGIERTEFLTKTFGKSGVDMGKILEMDTNAIRNFKAESGQILSEKDLTNIKEYNHAWDQLSDKWQSAGNAIGKSVMPAKTALADMVNGYLTALEKLSKNPFMKTTDFLKNLMDAKHAINDEKAAFLSTKDATDALSDSTDNLAETQKQEAETAKALSSTFTSLLSSMSTIQKSNDDYAKSTGDIAKSDQDLKDKKQQLTYEWSKQVQAGKDTVDGYKTYMAALSDVSKAEADNADKKAKLDEDVKKATQQRKYDLVENKLAVDGVSTKEFDYLENLKVNYGLVSRAAADQAIAENQAADQLVSGFESTLPPMEQSLQIMKQIAAFNGTRVNFGVNFSQSGSVNMPGSYSPPRSYSNNVNGNALVASAASGTGHKTQSRDSGGAGIAGTPYMIGTGAQPEMFIPKTNGTFLPKGQQSGMGATYNITINNPVPTKSDDSVRRALQLASLTGKFS